MQIVLIILSIALLGLIIRFAISPNSSRLLRLAALIAMGLIGLSLGVASIFIALSDFKNEAEEVHLPIFLEAQREAPNRGNIVEIVVFLVIFAIVLGLIFVIASRDRKRKQEEAKKAGASPLFSKTAKPGDLNLKAEESSDKAKEDDGFNLELD